MLGREQEMAHKEEAKPVDVWSTTDVKNALDDAVVEARTPPMPGSSPPVTLSLSLFFLRSRSLSFLPIMVFYLSSVQVCLSIQDTSKH